MRCPLVIYGNGSKARKFHHWLVNDSPYEVVAFTVDRRYMTEKTLLGLPVVPFDEITSRYSTADVEVFVAIGPIDQNRVRALTCAAAEALGYRLATYVSSSALVWPGTQLGDNCALGARTVISPSARIGKNVHIGVGCLIGPDVAIGDNCSLSMGATIMSKATLETNCTVRGRAIVGNGLQIAAETRIELGAVVFDSIREPGTYLGNPARRQDSPN